MNIIKSTPFSTILSNAEKISVSDPFIVNKDFDFVKSQSFSYIKDIQIVGKHGTIIDFFIGGDKIDVLSTTINDNTVLNDDHVTISLDFPSTV